MASLASGVVVVLLLAARQVSAARGLLKNGADDPAFDGGAVFMALLPEGVDAATLADSADRCTRGRRARVVASLDSIGGLVFQTRSDDVDPEHTAAQIQADDSNIIMLEDDSDVFAAQAGSTADAQWDVTALLGSYGIAPLTSSRIAVLDTGLSAAHPDLQGVGFDARTVGIAGQNVLNSVMSVVNPTVPVDSTDALTDLNGHGTHIAGTIAALADGVGVAGVAGDSGPVAGFASVVPVKVMGPITSSGKMSNVITGINWVAANAAALNIKVAVLSLAGAPSALADAAVARLTAASVLVVTAAGNVGGDYTMQSPARAPDALTVTSVDSTGAPSPTSSYSTGPGRVVASYGVAIQSTYIGALPYKLLSGTSFAAPHVAALAAWCMEPANCCAGMSPAQVKARILASGAEVMLPATAVGTTPKFYGPIVTKDSLCGLSG